MSAEELMPTGSRVRLKPDCTDFYQIGTSKFNDEPVYVAPESEAHIMAHREDDGFELVLIRWDRDDWRYQGQEDGWAYPAHFEVVSKPQIEEPDEPDFGNRILTKMVDKAVKDEKDRCPACGHAHSEDTQDEADRHKYLALLSKATHDAAGADAFLMLNIVEEEFEGQQTLVPHFFSATMDEKSAILLEAQLTDIAATALRAHALTRLKEITDEP